MVLYKVFQTPFYVKMLEAIHTDGEPQSSLCVLYPPVSSPSPSLAGPWVLCSLHTPESSCGQPPFSPRFLSLPDQEVLRERDATCPRLFRYKKTRVSVLRHLEQGWTLCIRSHPRHTQRQKAC